MRLSTITDILIDFNALYIHLLSFIKLNKLENKASSKVNGVVVSTLTRDGRGCNFSGLRSIILQ